MASYFYPATILPILAWQINKRKIILCLMVCIIGIFGALPAELQCHMLSQMAETSGDILERCRLMTLVLERYPDRVPEQGVGLVC